MDSLARPSQPAKMTSLTGGTEGSSPASSPGSATSLANMAAPKFGTLVPNRVFVGGISASTSEAELAQLFSAYGNVKATKIIADRGGVSKGYGFVTFETEEEAKRLQQEAECIILKERKLNIAPAIKKQPFNRSFDGGTGSPPVAPTSTYYYTNGMGIPYQNGMTFYNTGAPAPGATIAPPADPATLYQAGLFGPQATASHQTFAPMMYPMPAPSLYMPQQYQYSPMPYEPYFPGTAAAGTPYIYTSNGPQAQTGGNGSGNGSNGGTGATCSGTASAPLSIGHSQSQYQTHYYGPANPHHHPASMTTSAHHGPPPPPPMEPIYYTYPPPLSHAQGPHHGQLALASDQLLVYTTEMTGHTQGNDSQISQEDSRLTNHAEQIQTSNTTTSDSGGGGSGGGLGGSSSNLQSTVQSPDQSNSSPTKYSPAVNRYPNYQSIPQQATASQTQQIANDGTGANEEQASTGAPHMHHYRIYPTPVYMPPPVSQYSPVVPSPGASLLPTPPSQPYDKFRSDYASMKPAGAGLVGSSPYAKGAPLIHQSPTFVKQYSSPGLQQPSTPHGMSGQQKYQAGRLPQQQQQYNKSRGGTNHQHHHQQQQTAFYFSPKACQYSPSVRHGQSFVYRSPQLSTYALPQVGSPHKAYLNPGREQYCNSGRRSTEHTEFHLARQQAARQKSAMVNNYRGSNLTMSAKSGPTSGQERISSPGNSNSSNSSRGSTQAPETSTTSSTENSATATVIATTPPSATTTNSSVVAINVSETANATATPTSVVLTPPISPYTSTTHYHPTVSPSPNPNQVQVYGPNAGGGQQQQQRYNSGPGLSQQQQQQQQPQRSRYQSSSTANRGGKSSNVLRQSSSTGSGAGKYKVNGIVQSNKVDETSLGGAGDAPPIGNRLPITPPGTPVQQSSSQGEQTQQQQQIGEACHQMQALSL